MGAWGCAGASRDSGRRRLSPACAGTVALNWLAPGSVESSSVPVWLLPPWGPQRERQADRLSFCETGLGALQDQVDMRCQGLVSTVPWGQEDTSGCGLLDMLHQDLVGSRSLLLPGRER